MSENMFGKSRRRLTLVYTCVMFIFLVLLTFLMHMAMEWAVTSEQTRELSDLATAVTEVQYRSAVGSTDSEPQTLASLSNSLNPSDDSPVYKNAGDRLFYYVFDAEGRLVNFSRASYRLESFVLEIIADRNAAPKESSVYSKVDGKGGITKLMIISRVAVMPDGNTHTVYIGKDVTAMYNGMQKATHAFEFLGILGLVVSSVAGYIMSGRAIIPLKEAYERQRQFAADASHELRTPLAVVLASAELLAGDASIKSPFLRQIIADVHDEVKKMAKLVGDLLLVARSDNKALTLKPTKFDLTALLAQTVRVMQPLAEKKNISINMRLRQEMVIHADEQKIKQLVLILVDNAVKYTPDGGEVSLGAEKKNYGRVAFWVADTGIGIDPKDQDKIFDRFFRVDKARSREMGGNGLGLAIAHEIVKMHKGRISVSSQPGQGTKFTVVLNVATKNKKEPEPAPQSDALGIPV